MDENALSKEIIGAAIEVHRQLGAGLVESIYEEALCHELHLRQLPFERQRHLAICYKGIKLATPLRVDLLVAGKVIVEAKAKEALAGADQAQLLSYLRLSGLRRGLLVDFHEPVLKSSIRRVVNKLVEAPSETSEI